MYCQYCGKELADEAVVCPNCGCATDKFQAQKSNSGTGSAAKVFMIIGCVLSAFYLLIPLCWTIPMTVIYCKRLKQGVPVGTGFKICSLLFVSLIAGILMLCDDEK